MKMSSGLATALAFVMSGSNTTLLSSPNPLGHAHKINAPAHKASPAKRKARRAKRNARKLNRK